MGAPGAQPGGLPGSPGLNAYNLPNSGSPAGSTNGTGNLNALNHAALVPVSQVLTALLLSVRPAATAADVAVLCDSPPVSSRGHDPSFSSLLSESTADNNVFLLHLLALPTQPSRNRGHFCDEHYNSRASVSDFSVLFLNHHLLLRCTHLDGPASSPSHSVPPAPCHARWRGRRGRGRPAALFSA